MSEGAKARKVPVVLIAILAAAIGGALGKGVVRTLFHSSPDLRSQKVLSDLASEYNKSLPMAVDRETELLSVLGLEATIVYNYRLVNLSAPEIDAAEFVRQMEPGLRNGACTTPQTRDDLLKKGITLRYSYADKDRVHITSIDVLPSSCGF